MRILCALIIFLPVISCSDSIYPVGKYISFGEHSKSETKFDSKHRYEYYNRFHDLQFKEYFGKGYVMIISDSIYYFSVDSVLQRTKKYKKISRSRFVAGDYGYIKKWNWRFDKNSMFNRSSFLTPREKDPRE